MELLLNGTSLGSKAVPPAGHAEWSVPYALGTLTVRAVKNGQVIATDSVTTTGAPATLKLTIDAKPLTANGEDAAVVAVSVVDAQGRVVPTAGDLITFAVTGAAHIAGVGNGDPSDHDPDRASQRHAFNGLCAAIIQAGETPGDATLTVTSPGLKSAALSLSVGKQP